MNKMKKKDLIKIKVKATCELCISIPGNSMKWLANKLEESIICYHAFHLAFNTVILASIYFT